MDQFVIHYHLDNDLHEMNAKILNLCEAKSLTIIEKVITALELNLEIQLVVRSEGGIRDILTFQPKTTFDRIFLGLIYPILLNVVIDLATNAISNPKQVTISDDQINQIADTITARIKTAPEPTTKEEISASEKRREYSKNIANYLQRFNTDNDLIDDLQRNRSAFYKALDSDNKVSAVSIEKTKSTDDKIEYIEQEKVEKKQFKDFILSEEKLDPVEDRDAVIEIISPVLDGTKNYKWKGIYNGEEIDFYMTDKDVKANIAKGLTKFGAGSLMSGVLEKKRKRNETGEIIITNYSLKEAFTIPTDDGGEFITNKGLKERQKIRDARMDNQPDLFDYHLNNK